MRSASFCRQRKRELMIFNIQPRPYTRGQVQMLEDLYARTYDKASKLNPPLAIQIHSSYVRETLQVDPLEFWRPFFEARNPALVMLEDHPYPG